RHTRSKRDWSSDVCSSDLLWSIPPFKALFASGGALYEWVINIPVPYLDKLVARMPPVVSEATAYAAVFKFDWFSATGTAILFARSEERRVGNECRCWSSAS